MPLDNGFLILKKSSYLRRSSWRIKGGDEGNPRSLRDRIRFGRWRGLARCAANGSAVHTLRAPNGVRFPCGGNEKELLPA